MPKSRAACETGFSSFDAMVQLHSEFCPLIARACNWHDQVDFCAADTRYRTVAPLLVLGKTVSHAVLQLIVPVNFFKVILGRKLGRAHQVVFVHRRLASLPPKRLPSNPIPQSRSQET